MKFHQNPEYGLLSIRHFDDFEAAESTTALVTINRLLSEYDRMALKNIIIDFRKIRSATLYNTDRALHSLVHEKLLPLPAGLKLYRLYDEEITVTPTLLERLDHSQNITEQTVHLSTQEGIFVNEQELLNHLNLPEHIKPFDDDLDWSMPNIDQALPAGE